MSYNTTTLEGLKPCLSKVPVPSPAGVIYLDNELAMTRVYAEMVADFFHSGHVEFFKKARTLGDYLIVGIHSDEVLISNDYKKGKPILTMEERVNSVEACRFVDEVLPNAPFIIDRPWIDEHNIEMVVRGDDMPQDRLEYFYKVPMDMGIFRTVPYTAGISTTEIIRRIMERSS